MIDLPRIFGLLPVVGGEVGDVRLGFLVSFTGPSGVEVRLFDIVVHLLVDLCAFTKSLIVFDLVWGVGLVLWRKTCTFVFFVVSLMGSIVELTIILCFEEVEIVIDIVFFFCFLFFVLYSFVINR